MPEVRAAWLGGLVLLAPSYIYTEAPRYEGGAERFPAGAVLRLVSGGRSRALAPGFAASADACVSFDGRRVLFAGKRGGAGRWQIWEAPIEGGEPRQAAETEGDAIRPLYLPEGRIVYSVRTAEGFQMESAGRRLTYGPGDHLGLQVLEDGRILFEGPRAELYTVYSDGSGVESVRCDHGRGRRAGREMASGDIIYESGGRLWRFTSALARGVAIPAPAGEFAGPVAEVPGGWLVAYRRNARERFALFRMSGEALERVSGTVRGHAVDPVAVVARRVPKRHPSSLGKGEGANLLCLSVYRPPDGVPPGSVAAVRVWAREDGGAPAALGQAPVAADGSFFVQVPGERPVRFELLDRAGKAVAAERGWFWLRRGEQRVCVGCHAGPEQAPENAVPAVLLHSQEPVRLGLPKGGSR